MSYSRERGRECPSHSSADRERGNVLGVGRNDGNRNATSRHKQSRSGNYGVPSDEHERRVGLGGTRRHSPSLQDYDRKRPGSPQRHSPPPKRLVYASRVDDRYGSDRYGNGSHDSQSNSGSRGDFRTDYESVSQFTDNVKYRNIGDAQMQNAPNSKQMTATGQPPLFPSSLSASATLPATKPLKSILKKKSNPSEVSIEPPRPEEILQRTMESRCFERSKLPGMSSYMDPEDEDKFLYGEEANKQINSVMLRSNRGQSNNQSNIDINDQYGSSGMWRHPSANVLNRASAASYSHGLGASQQGSITALSEESMSTIQAALASLQNTSVSSRQPPNNPQSQPRQTDILAALPNISSDLLAGLKLPTNILSDLGGQPVTSRSQPDLGRTQTDFLPDISRLQAEQLSALGRQSVELGQRPSRFGSAQPLPVIEEQKKDETTNTIQNILQSIGFDFGMSKRMQELAKEKEDRESNKTKEKDICINQSASFLGGGLSDADLTAGLFKRKEANRPFKNESVGNKSDEKEKMIRKDSGQKIESVVSSQRERKEDEHSVSSSDPYKKNAEANRYDPYSGQVGDPGLGGPPSYPPPPQFPTTIPGVVPIAPHPMYPGGPPNFMYPHEFYHGGPPPFIAPHSMVMSDNEPFDNFDDYDDFDKSISKKQKRNSMSSESSDSRSRNNRRRSFDRSPHRRNSRERSPRRRYSRDRSPRRIGSIERSPYLRRRDSMERRSSLDRSPRRRSSLDRSPRRRSSLDRSPRRSSLDRSPRRSSFDRSPRRRNSFDRSPRRRSLLDRSPRMRSSLDRSPRGRNSFDRSPRRRHSLDRSPMRRNSLDRSPRRRNSFDRSPRRSSRSPRNRFSVERSPLRRSPWSPRRGSRERSPRRRSSRERSPWTISRERERTANSRDKRSSRELVRNDSRGSHRDSRERSVKNDSLNKDEVQLMASRESDSRLVETKIPEDIKIQIGACADFRRVLTTSKFPETLRKPPPEHSRIVLLPKTEHIRKITLAPKPKSEELAPAVKLMPEIPPEINVKLKQEHDDRQKKLDNLEREMDKLRKQQNEIMRKRQRQKDGHKDPLLTANSKLQEEISEQIKALRKSAEEPVDLKKFQSSSPGEVKSETQASPGSNKYYKFRDGGSHWCRYCNNECNSVVTYCKHLKSKFHQQKADPYDRPWTLHSMNKKPESNTNKGPVNYVPVQGSEFMMSVDAFYCSLCNEFMGDVTSAEAHLKDMPHFRMYQAYLNKNPFYVKRYLLEKSAKLSILKEEMKEEREKNRLVKEEKKKERKTFVDSRNKEKDAKIKENEKRWDKEVDDLSDDRRLPDRRKGDVADIKLKLARQKEEEEDAKNYGKFKWKKEGKGLVNKPATLVQEEDETVEEEPAKPCGPKLFLPDASESHFPKPGETKKLPTTKLNYRAKSKNNSEEKTENAPIPILVGRITRSSTTPKSTVLPSWTPVTRKIPGQKDIRKLQPQPQSQQLSKTQAEHPVPLDQFLSMGQEGRDKALPVVPELNLMSIPLPPTPPKSNSEITTMNTEMESKAEQEDLKLLGIDPESRAPLVTPIPPPPVSQNMNLPSHLSTLSMSATSADNMYEIYFEHKDNSQTNTESSSDVKIKQESTIPCGSAVQIVSSNPEDMSNKSIKHEVQTESTDTTDILINVSNPADESKSNLYDVAMDVDGVECVDTNLSSVLVKNDEAISKVSIDNVTDLKAAPDSLTDSKTEAIMSSQRTFDTTESKLEAEAEDKAIKSLEMVTIESELKVVVLEAVKEDPKSTDIEHSPKTSDVENTPKSINTEDSCALTVTGDSKSTDMNEFHNSAESPKLMLIDKAITSTDINVGNEDLKSEQFVETATNITEKTEIPDLITESETLPESASQGIGSVVKADSSEVEEAIDHCELSTRIENFPQNEESSESNGHDIIVPIDAENFLEDMTVIDDDDDDDAHSDNDQLEDMTIIDCAMNEHDEENINHLDSNITDINQPLQYTCDEDNNSNDEADFIVSLDQFTEVNPADNICSIGNDGEGITESVSASVDLPLDEESFSENISVSEGGGNVLGLTVTMIENFSEESDSSKCFDPCLADSMADESVSLMDGITDLEASDSVDPEDTICPDEFKGISLEMPDDQEELDISDGESLGSSINMGSDFEVVDECEEDVEVDGTET